MKKSLLAASLMFAFGAASAASAVTNGSFETSNVTSGNYKYSSDVTSGLPGPDYYNVSAPTWSFTGSSGIANGSTAWGGIADAGTSYAFLQGAGATISQTFSGGTGLYTIDFSLAARTGMDYSGAQSLTVYLDSAPLQLVGPVTTTVIQPSVFAASGRGGWTDYSFSVASTAGLHTLTFKSLGYYSQDTSAFLDKVSVAAPVPEPESYAMMLAGLGLMGFVARRRKGKQA